MWWVSRLRHTMPSAKPPMQHYSSAARNADPPISSSAQEKMYPPRSSFPSSPRQKSGKQQQPPEKTKTPHPPYRRPPKIKTQQTTTRKVVYPRNFSFMPITATTAAAQTKIPDPTFMFLLSPYHIARSHNILSTAFHIKHSFFLFSRIRRTWVFGCKKAETTNIKSRKQQQNERPKQQVW